MKIYCVTETVIGRHARAEASFVRHHTGNPPAPTKPLKPLWQDILAGLLLVAFIGVLVFI